MIMAETPMSSIPLVFGIHFISLARQSAAAENDARAVALLWIPKRRDDIVHLAMLHWA
jgi:hypothetical protein